MSLLKAITPSEETAAAPTPSTRKTRDDRVERARKYLAKMPPAISGQGGHTATWNAARKLAQDFELSEEQVFCLLRDDFNPHCQPRWSERELRHKARDAVRKARVSNPVEDREQHWQMPAEHYAGPNHWDQRHGYESGPPPGMFDDDEPTTEEESAPKPAPPATPASVIGTWRAEGALHRIPTGLEALDKACRGGLPVPWRVFLIGAPSAGKTAVEVTIANTMARAATDAGACVGILAIDEEPEDITVRLLQIAGFTIAESEAREPEMLRQMETALAELRLRLYDLTWTIEAAAADLAAWSKEQRRHGVLFVDSLQTARTAEGFGKTPREAVEANVRAIRLAATRHRLLLVATSEANRASYRSEDAAKDTNDLAAGAETRAIEFGAQTLLVLRTPKDEADVIHVKVAKNRRAYLGEFWLRLDRERHRVTECDDPSADPDRVANRQQEQRQSVKASVLFDAEHLASVLRCHPDGLGERALRAELRAQGFSWGVTRLAAAKAALAAGHKGCRMVEVDHGQGKAKLAKLINEPTSEELAAE